MFRNDKSAFLYKKQHKCIYPEEVVVCLKNKEEFLLRKRDRILYFKSKSLG
jgi:hypothetical protein